MQITENYRIIDGSQRVGIRRPEEGVFTGHPGQGGAGCTGIITQEFKAFPYQYFMLSPHKMLTAYTEKHKKRRNSPQFEGSFELYIFTRGDLAFTELISLGNYDTCTPIHITHKTVANKTGNNFYVYVRFSVNL